MTHIAKTIELHRKARYNLESSRQKEDEHDVGNMRQISRPGKALGSKWKKELRIKLVGNV